MQKILKELFDQFVKTNGREPDNLEMILMRQKASAQEANKRKIVSMFDRSSVNPDKPILGGKNIEETDAQILERLNKGNENSLSNMRYENAVKAEEAKAAADENYIMKVLDPEDFSDGGRAGFAGGGSFKLFLKNFFKPKKLETVNEFVDKRQFLKDLVGNTEKNKKARELKMLREAAEEARENPGFKFKDIDVDKEIKPIFDQSKDRTLNSTGGRAGYYGGGAAMVGEDLSEIGHGSNSLMARNMQLAPNSMATTSTGLNYLLGEDNDTVRVPYNEGKNFKEYLKDREMNDKKMYEEQLMREYLEDMRRKKVMDSKQMAAEGGRIGYNEGNMVLPKAKPAQSPLVELSKIYKTYEEAMPGVSKDTQQYLQQDFIQKLQNAKISQEEFMTYKMQNNFAEGGPARQNFKMGKRAFLKLIGSGVAGIASLKTGLLDFTKGGGKKVAKEVVKEATGGPPAYFFKLVDKIRKLGDDAPRLAVKDKENVTTFKEYQLTEDITTGEQTIQRMKVTDPDSASYYGQPLTEETYMSYKPGKGQVDETMKGKTPPDEYEEGTALLRSDGMNAGEIVEESAGISDEIFEEVGEVVPEAIRKEKADGGRIGYAGGKKVVDAIIKKVNKKSGKKAVTTADKAEIPKETLLRDMFTDTNKRLNKKREMTADEYDDFVEEVGGEEQLEAYNFDGTVGDAERILKEQESYMKYMYDQYKTGKLDPVAGDKSPARKRFLEKKMEEMEMSGDKRLMTREEIEELSSFDLGTQMDQMKDIDISQGMIDLDELNFTSNAKAAKEAIDSTSDADLLMKKYPGMGKELAEQIATDTNPKRKANVIAMVEQTFKMSEKGMSGDDIIQTFKNTTRTKQATGGLASILG